MKRFIIIYLLILLPCEAILWATAPTNDWNTVALGMGIFAIAAIPAALAWNGVFAKNGVEESTEGMDSIGTVIGRALSEGMDKMFRLQFSKPNVIVDCRHSTYGETKNALETLGFIVGHAGDDKVELTDKVVYHIDLKNKVAHAWKTDADKALEAIVIPGFTTMEFEEIVTNF